MSKSTMKPCKTCKLECADREFGLEEGFEENSKQVPCYDCGSTIPEHHTHNCDLTVPCDKLDLGTQSPDVQWWDGKPPKE